MLSRATRLTVALACATVVTHGGCKSESKSPPASGTPSAGSGAAGGSAAPVPPVAKPPPAFATADAKLKRYQECLAAFNAGNTEVLRSCYAKGSVREQIDSVPELLAQDTDAILEMISAQRAAFPDLQMAPRTIVVSGNTVAAVLHVSGTNSAAAGGMKATGKKLGLFEAEIAVIDDDGHITRDSFYVDQPTVYHQLGLLENDGSPSATAKPAGDAEILIAKDAPEEAANKAQVTKTLEAVTAKNAAAIDAEAADAIRFVYHGEKQPVTTKKAYGKWMKDMLKTTETGSVEVTGMWAAGDVVFVSDVFTGTPSKAIAPDGGQIKNHVVQVFRIANGKIAQHEIFANRLNTAVQLGMVDPDELMKTLAAASQ